MAIVIQYLANIVTFSSVTFVVFSRQENIGLGRSQKFPL